MRAVPVAGSLPPGSEQNIWPAWVAQRDVAGGIQEWQAVGPLFFRKPLPEGMTARGFRPFYFEKHNGAGALTEWSFLYPILVYRTDGEVYRWSILNLINLHAPEPVPPGTPATTSHSGFDVWPFYFSRQTGSPDTSYRALFPIAGDIKQRLYNDRLTWVLWPLYFRMENRGAIMTGVPWPFLRFVSGNGNSGFALWPLFGWRGKPGVYHSEFYLWPLIYRNQTHLDQPQPSEAFGVLPFYSRDRAPGMISETYAWPFFGYSDLTAPFRYHETRYFWPLLVQGRGEDHYINRWAPFYTHSVMKGVDKTWYMWPLIRHQEWTTAGIVQSKTQFFYFFFWSLLQRSATNPNLARAELLHMWPFFSYWDNGAGRRQLQVLNPLEPFVGGNEETGIAWTPLFALYRYDRPAPGSSRQTWLFNFISLRREPDHREFHLGPLLQVESSPAASRVVIAGGLLGWQRQASGWQPFWFDFSPKTANNGSPTSR